ncbi:MAG: nitrite reductase/ring-hydroxylating ferredoxin subunit [Patiriisocius sp.]|jgi:nitrite reductase/ring-hydroxylating ferredoxin subunit
MISMAAEQANALSRNPNQLNLVRVATYERLIKANISRVWENVLDWEHLPWLHDSSFVYVRLDAAGEWGWRTWSNAEKTGSVELCVNREKSEYVARSYQGGQQISEIWTRLVPVQDHTEIEVTFDLPNVSTEKKTKLGSIFLKLYTHLWDEDEDMMQQRETRLQQRFSEPASNTITLQKPLQLPLNVPLGRGDWTLQEVDSQLVVHSAICPHLLGPLNATRDGKTVNCPWHGYEFDIRSGDCLTSRAATCRLKTPPSIVETDSSITLILQ